jgi:hypothetical protein
MRGPSRWTWLWRRRTIDLCPADGREAPVDRSPPPRRSSTSSAGRGGCARSRSGSVVVRAHRPFAPPARRASTRRPGTGSSSFAPPSRRAQSCPRTFSRRPRRLRRGGGIRLPDRSRPCQGSPPGRHCRPPGSRGCDDDTPGGLAGRETRPRTRRSQPGHDALRLSGCCAGRGRQAAHPGGARCRDRRPGARRRDRADRYRPARRGTTGGCARLPAAAHPLYVRPRRRQRAAHPPGDAAGLRGGWSAPLHRRQGRGSNPTRLGRRRDAHRWTRRGH